MHRRLVVHHGLALLAASVLSACGGSDGPLPLELEHLPTSALGPVPAGTRVFRTQADWAAFWQAHPTAFGGASPPPAVDFGRHAVAGVFAGSKPRCRSLEIHAGSLAGGVATLRWRIVTFGQSTPSSCIGGDPFNANLADLVLIPATAVEVVFVDETA